MKHVQFIIGMALTVSLVAACSPTNSAEVVPTAETVAQPAPAQVVASGIVVPIRTSDLSFQIGGTVSEVLVEEGATIDQNAPLARLNTRDLELDVAAAEARVREAQANYQQIAAGATEEQIAVATTLVEQASASAQQVQGSVTNADLQAAREQVAQAQANLAALGSAGDTPAVQTARANVIQAQVNLQSQRDTLSRNKTAADSAITTTTQDLVQAQAAYAEAKSNWDYVQQTGNNPSQPERVNSQGRPEDNEVESAQREQYYAAFVRTEAALRQGEQAVQQAQIDAEEARKAEVTGIQAAEAQVAAAQTALDELLAGGSEAARAAARAQVADAQAQLARLTGEQRAGELAAASANVQNAQAALAELTAPTREVDLAVAQAAIESAEVALEQARQELEKATLRAPFRGTVAQVQLDIGEEVAATSGSNGSIVLGDFSTWQIETDDLTERDVVRFAEGASAQVTFEALPEVVLDGTVTNIQPIGEDKFGDMTYTVTITPDTWDERLRWNMSATVVIETP